MAYADQSMSSGRMVAIGVVALLHVVLGYAFISGLAYNVVKKVASDLKTFDVVEEAPPPEEEPPPPPPDQPLPDPPPFVPPPIVAPPISVAPPPIQQTRTPTITLPPPVAQPAPPPKPSVAAPAKERGNASSWVTTEDYPSRALREDREGVTAISFQITAEGRAANCQVTSSSGSPDLDQATCTNFTRRARYTPAKDAAGNAMASNGNRRVRWQIPQD